MNCPKCNSASIYVVNTNPSEDGSIYRGKKCTDCGAIFRTVEVLDDGSEEFKRGYYAAAMRRRGGKVC